MINIETWTKRENGFLFYSGQRLVKDVFADVIKELAKRGLNPDVSLEYLNPTHPYDSDGALFPRCQWVGVFCVEGGNEGWYLHVEAVCLRGTKDPRIREGALVLLGKTLGGLEDLLPYQEALQRAFSHNG